MSSLDKLIRLFERFPGIGSRQARRFANHILTDDPKNVDELATLIGEVRSHVAECESCFRFFAKNGNTALCPICSDEKRDPSKLTVVATDADIAAIEKTGTYDGRYFVLGGMVPLLDSEDTKKLRGGALKKTVEKQNGELKELILAFAVNPDGENTARYIKSILGDLIDAHGITVTELGRGLSTGSELEYADPETIKSALLNRH